MRTKNECKIFLNFVFYVFNLNVNFFVKKHMCQKNLKKISTKKIYSCTINLINKCLKHETKTTFI